MAHIINPVSTDDSSDLLTAQAITFETMKTARDFSSPWIEVTQLTAQFSEDRPAIPPGFTPTSNLKRSVMEISSFNVPRKLPLIKDILDRLFHESTAEYLIYTNVDIGLQPYFYSTVSNIIDQGYDAFIINHRTIPGSYKHIGDIALMYSELGEKHPGWDCIVFKRNLFPKFELVVLAPAGSAG